MIGFVAIVVAAVSMVVIYRIVVNFCHDFFSAAARAARRLK